MSKLGSDFLPDNVKIGKEVKKIAPEFGHVPLNNTSTQSAIQSAVNPTSESSESQLTGQIPFNKQNANYIKSKQQLAAEEIQNEPIGSEPLSLSELAGGIKSNPNYKGASSTGSSLDFKNMNDIINTTNEKLQKKQFKADPNVDPAEVLDRSDLTEHFTAQTHPELNAQEPSESQKITSKSKQTPVEFGVPSRGYFYGMDKVYIRDFKYREMMHYAMTQRGGSFLNIIDAVGNTIHNWDYKQLTFGDFIAIMYFQRMRKLDATNKNKNNFTVQWVCQEEDHIKRVGTSEEDQQELVNTDNLFRHMLKMHWLDIPKLNEFYKKMNMTQEQIKQGEVLPGLRLYPTTVGDYMAAFIQQISLNQALNEQELLPQALKIHDTMALLGVESEIASLISTYHGKTLQDRMKFIENYCDNSDMDPEDIIDTILEYRDVTSHSVREEVELTCKGCGVKQLVTVDFDPATTFFSFKL